MQTVAGLGTEKDSECVQFVQKKKVLFVMFLNCCNAKYDSWIGVQVQI